MKFSHCVVWRASRLGKTKRRRTVKRRRRPRPSRLRKRYVMCVSKWILSPSLSLLQFDMLDHHPKYNPAHVRTAKREGEKREIRRENQCRRGLSLVGLGSLSLAWRVQDEKFAGANRAHTRSLSSSLSVTLNAIAIQDRKERLHFSIPSVSYHHFHLLSLLPQRRSAHNTISYAHFMPIAFTLHYTQYWIILSAHSLAAQCRLI